MQINLQTIAENEFKIKIIVIGDQSTGKSTIINTYSGIKSSSIATLGIDFVNKKIIIDEKEISILIVDTAGSERYRSLTKNFYNGSQIILIVYDITQRNTFDHIVDWIKLVKENINIKGLCIGIIGNKIDLENERKVPFSMAQAFSNLNAFYFNEISALGNKDSVDKLFDEIIKKFLNSDNSIQDKYHLSVNGIVNKNDIHSKNKQQFHLSKNSKMNPNNRKYPKQCC